MEPTSAVEEGNAAIAAGITFPIIYPLWGYLGAGIGYSPEYEEYSGYNVNVDGTRTETEVFYFKDKNQSQFELFPEGGVQVKVFKAVVVKYGLTYSDTLFQQFGLGSQL